MARTLTARRPDGHKVTLAACLPGHTKSWDLSNNIAATCPCHTPVAVAPHRPVSTVPRRFACSRLPPPASTAVHTSSQAAHVSLADLLAAACLPRSTLYRVLHTADEPHPDTLRALDEG